MTAHPPVRIVLADDHAMMRAAFRTILEAHDLLVVGEAADGREAIRVVQRERPTVILLDIRMPVLDGIEAAREILDSVPDTRVLVLTTFDDDDLVDAALRVGVAGFLLKNSTPEELVRAVRRVAAGDSVLDPSVTARVVARLANMHPLIADRRAVERLTEREKDVLHLMAQGLSNAEIAATLHVGEATAKTHLSRVLSKLGVRDRVQAVIHAHETGFASTPRRLG